MGRTTKYATLRQYQPYIDVIRKDLKIPKKASILIWFTNINVRRTGDAIYFPIYNYGEMHISKFQSHTDTLLILLHEFRHIWQYATGILKDVNVTIKGKDVNHCYWRHDGILYRDYSRISSKYRSEYLASPWEVDAYNYEKKLFKLFPDGELPVDTHKLVGAVSGVKFFKVN